MKKEGIEVSHAHLKYMNPMPKNLGEILSSFDKVLIPEMNMGQLLMLIRAKFMIPAIGYSKVRGLPFSTHDIVDKVKEILTVDK